MEILTAGAQSIAMDLVLRRFFGKLFDGKHDCALASTIRSWDSGQPGRIEAYG